MNAAEIRDALEQHWKPAEYLVLHECPQDAMRMGRKIDTLVVSLWKSRGYELDAIEIKVSVSDWMREVNEPAKADWWWEHSHRFSVAVPVTIADRVRETLPTGWGLLAVNDGKVATVVKPVKHAAEPLPWQAIVGIMRGASGAGANALMREFEKGREHGVKEVRARVAANPDNVVNAHNYDELLRKVRAFKEETGIDIAGARFEDNARELGVLVNLVREWQRHPDWATKHLTQTAEQLRRHAEGLSSIAGALLPVTTDA